MSHFRGEKKKKSYFEGWYFKHQCGEHTVAFIPGIHIDDEGRRAAFIQIVTGQKSYHVPYKFPAFRTTPDRFEFMIGNNRFSDRGIKIQIDDNAVCIHGEIRYGEITPVKSDIMGPFGFIPFMECNHGVISLYHKLQGEIILNGESIRFNEGTGYIEKDWGRSFPKSYLWTQCSDFGVEKGCVMASIADIPLFGFYFKGCICSVYFEGREYRLATYNGVKIERCDAAGFSLRQGSYRLEASLDRKTPQPLRAPDCGKMSRMIHENAMCRAIYHFTRNNETLFRLESDRASFEYVPS